MNEKYSKDKILSFDSKKLIRSKKCIISYQIFMEIEYKVFHTSSSFFYQTITDQYRKIVNK